MAHMDFPFIESKNNFIMDYHLVYAGILLLLVVARAGQVWGLDGVVQRLPFFQDHPGFRPLVS
jgi:thiosulfate dehydrogenase [quinone] large subunit